MKFVLTIVLATLAGCYSPQLGSPGYFCHDTDHPACPDGQVCLNGRCTDHNRSGSTDLSFVLIPPDGGAEDLAQSMGSTDMARVVTGKTGCHGHIQCLLACGSVQSCWTACDSNTTTDGMTKYSNALGCEQTYCLNTTFECMLDSTMTKLIDPTGAPPGTCNNCLNNATAQLFGTSCTGTTDCNPASCSSMVSACLNSLP